MEVSEVCREMTEGEMRKEFLDHIHTMVSYWDGLPNKTSKEKLNGLAFSILVLLDGGTDLPAFKVIPYPHSEDKAYAQENEENWWSDEVDLAGGLHEEWHKGEK